MLSFATLPKPFVGHIGLIQRNAIRSWLAMDPRPEVFLFGDDEGVAEAAREFGVRHIPEIPDRNEFGTPLVGGVFRRFEAEAHNDLLCYCNADILLLSDFLPAMRKAADAFDKFLCVGLLNNLDVRKPLPFDDPNWEKDLRAKNKAEGKFRGNTADYFTYRRGTYPGYPPVTLGRPHFDTWLIWEARRLGHPVVDATPAVEAIHQNHFYSAVPGEAQGRHNGLEAQRNYEIIGDRRHVYRPTEATHRLTPSGLRRSWSGTWALRLQREHALRMTRRFIARLIRPVRPLLVKIGLLPPIKPAA